MQATLNNLKLQHPTEFPLNTIKAQRILTAIRLNEPHLIEPVARAFWVIYFFIIILIQLRINLLLLK